MFILECFQQSCLLFQYPARPLLTALTKMKSAGRYLKMVRGLASLPVSVHSSAQEKSIARWTGLALSQVSASCDLFWWRLTWDNEWLTGAKCQSCKSITTSFACLKSDLPPCAEGVKPLPPKRQIGLTILNTNNLALVPKDIKGGKLVVIFWQFQTR